MFKDLSVCPVAQIMGSSTTSSEDPGPTTLSQALFPGDRYLEASVADSEQNPLSTKKGNSREPESSLSFQRVRP